MTPAQPASVAETTIFAPSPENQRALRDAFGRFGTGVTVITTQTSEGPVGMTANSFSSVSLEPALVLWSPALASKRYPAFREAKHFCIHVLAEDQDALAQRFATQGNAFAESLWSVDKHGVPVLSGCLAEFHCTTYANYPAGDHALILGEIHEVCVSACDRRGLLFERSGFGRFHPLGHQ